MELMMDIIGLALAVTCAVTLLTAVDGTVYTISMMINVLIDIYQLCSKSTSPTLEKAMILLKSIVVMSSVVIMEYIITCFISIPIYVVFNFVKLYCIFAFNTNILHEYYDRYIALAVDKIFYL